MSSLFSYSADVSYNVICFEIIFRFIGPAGKTGSDLIKP
jgi:hypothetical protein